MRLNLDTIVSCTGGRLVVEPSSLSAIATGVTWDSRTVSQGDVYIALPGERVDGHSFTAAAFDAGAVCALVSKSVDDAISVAKKHGAAIVEVPDTAVALTNLAKEWRTHLKGRVIALTGSTGKTTTKNLVRDVLAAAGTVVATAGNQNNELGVPKTVLSADADTQAVVVEMGMRGLGQLAELCEFVKPEWGIVVNVGESHIELLGSRDNIARAKAELLCSLPDDKGRAFVNVADDYASFVCQHAALNSRGVSVATFDGSGQAFEHQEVCDSDASVWAEQIALDNKGRPHFVLHAKGFSPDESVESSSCSLELRGVHNVSNACCAAAVGLSAGMNLATVIQALESAQPEGGRQEVLSARRGFTVINDAYNANPDSMRASLMTFAALQASRHIAVLGDMGELGDFAQDGHERIGRFVATLSLDLLVCVGSLSQLIMNAAIDAGMNASCIVHVLDAAEALEYVDSFVQPGDAVLVKASHFLGLERVAIGLVD